MRSAADLAALEARALALSDAARLVRLKAIGVQVAAGTPETADDAAAEAKLADAEKALAALLPAAPTLSAADREAIRRARVMRSEWRYENDRRRAFDALLAIVEKLP